MQSKEHIWYLPVATFTGAKILARFDTNYLLGYFVEDEMKKYFNLLGEGDTVEGREFHRINYNAIEAKKQFFDRKAVINENKWKGPIALPPPVM